MNRVQNTRKNNSPLDFYATHPDSVRAFLKEFDISNKFCWEPACGTGNICKVLEELKIEHIASDINDYYENHIIADFLKYDSLPFDYLNCLITNPPYKYSIEFLTQFFKLFKNKPGALGIFYLKLLFLESKRRYNLFKVFPPKYIYVHSSRQGCSPEGDFDFKNSGAVAYMWAIWEIGYYKEPVIRWIPPN
jgi:hypothetical protein